MNWDFRAVAEETRIAALQWLYSEQGSEEERRWRIVYETLLDAEFDVWLDQI